MLFSLDKFCRMAKLFKTFELLGLQRVLLEEWDYLGVYICKIADFVLNMRPPLVVAGVVKVIDTTTA